jgi:hypothetical protein
MKLRKAYMEAQQLCGGPINAQFAQMLDDADAELELAWEEVDCCVSWMYQYEDERDEARDWARLLYKKVQEWEKWYEAATTLSYRWDPEAHGWILLS